MNERPKKLYRVVVRYYYEDGNNIEAETREEAADIAVRKAQELVATSPIKRGPVRCLSVDEVNPMTGEMSSAFEGLVDTVEIATTGPRPLSGEAVPVSVIDANCQECGQSIQYHSSGSQPDYCRMCQDRRIRRRRIALGLRPTPDMIPCETERCGNLVMSGGTCSACQLRASEDF